MEKYLLSTNIIDWKHPHVIEKSKELSKNHNDPFSIAKACFEFVRDEINTVMISN